MLRKILLLAALSLTLWAVDPITVVDTVRSPIGGRLFNGSLSITSNTPLVCGGQAFSPDIAKLTIISGALSVTLMSNADCLPTGNYYRASFLGPPNGKSWTEIWVVQPGTTGTVGIAAIRNSSSIAPVISGYPGDATKFLNGLGLWAIVPPGTAGGGTWGTITGTLSDQTDLDSALSAKQATITSGTDLTMQDLTAKSLTLQDGVSTQANIQICDEFGVCLILATPLDVEPTCDVTMRWRLQPVTGGTGVSDAWKVCVKGSDDNYSWKVVSIT